MARIAADDTFTGRSFAPYAAVVAGENVSTPAVAAKRPRPSNANAAHVLGVRHWFQVVRVDARADAAQMVELKTLRNRADHPFVGDSINLLPTKRRGITVPVAYARPEPATELASWFLDTRQQRTQSSRSDFNHE